MKGLIFEETSKVNNETNDFRIINVFKMYPATSRKEYYGSVEEHLVSSYEEGITEFFFHLGRPALDLCRKDQQELYNAASEFLGVKVK